MDVLLDSKAKSGAQWVHMKNGGTMAPFLLLLAR